MMFMCVYTCEICVSVWVGEWVYMYHYCVSVLVFNIQGSMTALMLATQRGHKDIIKALVERKLIQTSQMR